MPWALASRDDTADSERVAQIQGLPGTQPMKTGASLWVPWEPIPTRTMLLPMGVGPKAHGPPGGYSPYSLGSPPRMAPSPRY